jgi:hypothetical protein
MKWYFAARTKQRELITTLTHTLQASGHEVVFQWSTLPTLEPYDQHESACKKTAQKITEAISQSDIFVLISDPGGTDMFVELGIALANNARIKKPRIYIVGAYNKRSLMHLHPCIQHADVLEDVFRKECPQILNEITSDKTKFYKK